MLSERNLNGPPHQEDRADETSTKREQQPHIHKSWSSGGTSTTAGHKQSKRFLESFDDNFCLHVIEESRRRGIAWALFSQQGGLEGNVKPKGSLGSQDHK